MNEITEALKNQCNYKEIKELYDAWDDSSKELLLADLAIVHRNYDAIRFIGDEAGVDIFYTPYDNNDRITPFYIAELLWTLNSEYQTICDFINR